MRLVIAGSRTANPYGEGLLLFWDGQSRGSANMLVTMKKLGKPAMVVDW